MAIHGAVGGAPSHLPPKTPWNGGLPHANGKSPITGPAGPTPEDSIAIDPNRSTFFHLKSKPPAPPSPGRQLGENAHRTSAKARARRGQQLDDETPWSAAVGVDSHHPQTPIRPDHHSIAAGREPSSPTLCTRRETGFPRPPAAGAAGGDRESPRLSACEVDRPVDLQISFQTL
jgi:hypothetical protein